MSKEPIKTDVALVCIKEDDNYRLAIPCQFIIQNVVVQTLSKRKTKI